MIIEIKSDIKVLNMNAKNPEEIINSNKYQYNKTFDIPLITMDFLQGIMEEIKEKYNFEGHFEAELEEDLEGNLVLPEEFEQFSKIEFLNFEMKEIAKDKRRIILLRDFQQQGIDFVKELEDPKLYTHPTKLNYTLFVEKGFSDIVELSSSYMSFLTSISNLIYSGDDIEGMKTIYPNIDRLRGNRSVFSFILGDVLWEVVNYAPESMSELKGSVYNRDPYVL